MVKRGLCEDMTSGEGLWFGWMGDEKFVSGVLATAVLNWEAAWSLGWGRFLCPAVLLTPCVIMGK